MEKKMETALESGIVMRSREAYQLMTEARTNYFYEELLPLINEKIEGAAKRGCADVTVSGNLFDDAAQHRRAIHILKYLQYKVREDERAEGLNDLIIGWE